VNPGARHLLRHALERIDERYRRSRSLHAVGPLLFVGLDRHDGECIPLGDGTRLEPGEWLGRLHFNNARAASLQAGNRAEAGVRFARLLRASLHELAERTETGGALAAARVFEGVTWLRVHGRSVGFEAHPLPDGWRSRLLSVHFRLLIRAFAPVTADAGGVQVRPHRFRITRGALIERFGRRARGGRSETASPAA
jgi:hypothetical protein